MGWLDKLRRKSPSGSRHAQSLNGFMPIFSQFGDDIYASDVVLQAVKCIVDELKKLNPTHARKIGSDETPVNSNIQAVLNNPNELMTTSEFIEKIGWQLFLTNNAFIIPSYYVWTDDKGVEKRHYNSLYPVAPTFVEFQEDVSGQLYVKMRFANNYETTLAYKDIIHIKYNYSVNEFMGGNKFGQPNNDTLLKTLQLNQTLLEGVAGAMKASFAINGVVKYNTLMDDGRTEAALKELEEKLRASESGFLPLDLKAEFTPIKHEIQLVDEATLKFIDEKILRHFGVPICILTGDYTKSQYDAFYQKTLEPIVIAISQAFTKTLFTQREKSFGNIIKLYPKDLIFMSVDQTLEMIRLLGDSGALFENEKRIAFGMRPLPELEGIRMMSLNYVNVEDAKKYQTGESDSSGKEDKKKDESKEDVDDDQSETARE